MKVTNATGITDIDPTIKQHFFKIIIIIIKTFHFLSVEVIRELLV